MIDVKPDEWDDPLSKWFDNMLNHPRKFKNITVRDESTDDERIYVRTPSGSVLDFSYKELRALDSLGLSLRRF